MLGTVFKLSNGKETVLHSFSGPDGIYPQSSVVLDSAGNLYGTATNGGLGGTHGPGTVFKIDTTGTFTVLHQFQVGTGDGFFPIGGLVLDSAGNLYGITSTGGASNAGTIYKITP